MIFRDDDINSKTDLKKFKEIHKLFLKYKVLHTIGLICKDIEKNKPLVKFLQAEVAKKKIDVQVHCWEHYDMAPAVGEYSTAKHDVRLKEDLTKCVKLIINLFKKPPTTLYPPWNRTSLLVNYIANDCGLKVSTEKISLSQYLRGVEGDVCNFHSWSDETKDLEPALIKYTS